VTDMPPRVIGMQKADATTPVMAPCIPRSRGLGELQLPSGPTAEISYCCTSESRTSTPCSGWRKASRWPASAALVSQRSGVTANKLLPLVGTHDKMPGKQ
jgi:hypothetical protein